MRLWLAEPVPAQLQLLLFCNGLVDRDQPVTVKLLGGDLNIFWDENDDQVYMTGPATTVFDGEIDLGFLGE